MNNWLKSHSNLLALPLLSTNSTFEKQITKKTAKKIPSKVTPYLSQSWLHQVNGVSDFHSVNQLSPRSDQSTPLTWFEDEEEDSTPPSSPPTAAVIPRRSKFEDEEDDSDVSGAARLLCNA